MDDGDKQHPADGDSIIIDVGEHASNVAAGKNVKQVIHQHAPAPSIDVDKALAKLAKLPLDEIPPVTPLPAGSHLPYAPNPYFTGRLDELRQLATALNGGESIAIGQPQIAGTTGMGGIGKSQLAAAFAHRYGRYFLGGVAWISLADAGSVPSEVVNACLGLPGLPPAVVDMDLPDQVRAIRQAWQSELPRLLIFDNCEEDELLAQWRPTTGAARVLVTSRRSHFDGSLSVQMLPLRTLPRPDSIDLLRRFRPDLADDDPDLDAIADELGDLPLALHMAGSFLKRYTNAVTPAAYLSQLLAMDPLAHRSLAEALGLSPTDHDLNVARTFALSVDRLNPENEVDALASALLARAACFAPGDPIPRQLLFTTLPAFEESDDRLIAEDAFLRLFELGLLDSDEQGDPILHRLLAGFVRSRQNNVTAQTDVEQTLYREANRLNQEGFPRKLLAWQSHLRHVTDIAFKRTDEETPRLCTSLGFHLNALGDLAGAKPYVEQALAIDREVLGEGHSETAGSLNNLGSLLQAQSDLTGAKPYLEQAFAIYQEVLGEDHPDTASSLNSLGTLLQAQGDLAGAKSSYERALTIRMEVLGKGHPDTAESLNNLGSLLQAQGDLAGAKPCLKRALAIYREVLGDGHPGTARSSNNLGSLLRAQGDLLGAKAYYEQALKIWMEVLGEDHPYTASSLNNLGSLLKAQGDLSGAKPYYERALAIFESALGSEHPNTQIARGNLELLLAQLDAD